MKILITGGGGMLGQKLIAGLAKVGSLNGKKIESITVVDAYKQSQALDGFDFKITSKIVDITDRAECDVMIAEKPDVIFHLAAIVSGEAESDFEKGYRVNVDGMRNLFEAIRLISNDYCPRVVFTSSVAVYGGPYLEVADDNFILQPATSYGVQKAIGELLLNDYSRRGFFDGVGLRIPTLCVRPGLPNSAASGVFSNIIREPLMGIEATLTAGKDASMIFTSPRSAVGFLIHAAQMDTSGLGARRSLMMPGIYATLGDEIDALRRVAGDKIVGFIKEEIDPFVQEMLKSWNFPKFDAKRARSLGFTCEDSFDELIKTHIADELGGQIPGLTK
ncbi:MAG: D-erythronate dehydrogenase [Actinomycetes bacterium]